MVTRGRGKRGGEKRVKVAKRYELEVTKYISHRDIIYSNVTIVNDTVLYI